MANPAATESVMALALAGPTAAGKTAAALAIAARRPVEIVSVDSALVFRGMDIGTAKPTRAELAAVPHHLIDIRDPIQAYSAAEFAADARRIGGEINARGRLALLVGGTMLYFKALFDGLHAMPRADAAVREAIDREAAAHGWQAMHAALARVDPVTAARLSPNDSQRIQRALEVFRVSGRTLASFHGADGADTAGGTGGAQAGLAMPMIALEPRDRAWLHARIAERFDAMLAAGLLDEVRGLRARGGLSPELASMRCVGYRQAWAYLDAVQAGGAVPSSELRDKGIFATRQLAKRQITWLRSMPARHTVACDAPDALAQVLTLAQRLAPEGAGARRQ